MPQLGDTHFQHAVVLMLEHTPAGAMGLVINRQAPLTLKDLAEGHSLPIAREREGQPVFLGGPVEPHRGFVLHDSRDIAERHEVIPGLFLSMTLDALSPLLARVGSRLRFCLGYAGWGPQQLEKEIATGAWLFTEASAGAALSGPAEALWEETLRGMGVDPGRLVSSPGVN